MGTSPATAPFTKRCHAWLETTTGCRKALLTHSCTGALEMAALLADLQPGDEVIMPSFTFVSTANAFVLRGAVPVFVDIRPDTLNLDETLDRGGDHAAHEGDLRRALRRRRLRDGRDRRDRAQRHGLRVIEDAAQGILSTYRGRPLGSIGRSRRAQLPRDEERDLRRGRRAARQRSRLRRARRDHPRERARTGASSSAVRSTSTPGWTSARPSCRARSSPLFWRRSWKRPRRSPARRLAIWEPLPCLGRAVEQRGLVAPADRARALRAQRPHVLPAAAEPRTARTPSSRA